MTDFVARTRAAFDDAASEGALSVLVTHDVVIRALVCALLDAPLRAMHRIHIDVASTSAVEVRPGEVALEWLNETSHLDAP
jgi:broad specificity phosphatase PhoE